MKNILLLGLILLFSISLFAFTPVIDGVKDSGWGTTPNHSTTTSKLPTEFNLDGGVYLTDDENYVYIGIPTDNDPWNDSMPVHFHVAIDLRNTTTGGTTDAWGSGILYGQTYKPDFDIITQWNNTDENCGWTALQTWTGTAWSQSQLPPPYIKGGGNQFTEISIPRSILGNIGQGETINISVWARPDYTKTNASVCLPADATFPTDWGNGPAGTFTTQFSYTVQTLLVGMIAPQMVSITQLTDSSFNVTFDEPMKEENATEPSNYTFGGGMTVSSITMVNPSVYTFTTSLKMSGGATYSVTAHPEITDLAGNSIDTSHNSVSFVALYYSNVTFQVNMNLEILAGRFVPETDQVCARGGFNGWGTTPLSDPNTDGIYTVTLSIPYGEGSSFEYKYWNNHNAGDNWESLPANRSYTIVGEDNIIPAVYWNDLTPSGITTHVISVTFRVNMDLEDTSGGVFVAGDFNSWNSTSNPMSMPTKSNIYFATIDFPAYSILNQAYKYINGTTWEYIDNRTFSLNDSLTTMTLDVVYFNNSIPTELTSLAFMQMANSFYTNFNDNDVLPAGSNLQFEVKLTPVDVNANSQYSASLHYRPVGAIRWMTESFTYDNTFENDSYWHFMMDNSEGFLDGAEFEFYITATDYNGPELTDDNSGSYYHVSVASGALPAPANVVITIVGHDLHVSWDAVPGATSYRVYYFDDPTNPSSIDYFTVTEPSIIMGGFALSDGHKFFHVTALN